MTTSNHNFIFTLIFCSETFVKIYLSSPPEAKVVTLRNLSSIAVYSAYNSYLQYKAYTNVSEFNSNTYLEKALHGQKQPWKSHDLWAELVVQYTLKDNPLAAPVFWNHSDWILSCTYLATQTSAISLTRNGNEYISDFTLIADCPSKNSIKINGGASIEAVSFGSKLNLCTSTDNFDDTYSIRCINGFASIRRECYNVSIIVDYEHFDAFSERGTFWDHQYPPLHHIVIENQTYCSKLSDHQYGDTHHAVASHSTGHAPLGKWCNDLVPSKVNFHYWDVYMSLPGTVNHAPNYKWVWSKSVFALDAVGGYQPGTTTLIDCLNMYDNMTILFLGSSHMHYTFDCILYDTSKSESGRNHLGPGTFSSKNMQYVEARFARNIAYELDKICVDFLTLSNSTSALKSTIVVFQTGSWDISFYAPQLFIESNKTAKAIVEVIKSFQVRGCSLIKIVFVTAPPYPRCDRGVDKEKCLLFRRARNNYALQAMNYFLEKELRKLAYPGLQIVPSYDIIAARLPFGERVCGPHYLCPDRSGGTPAGYVVAEAVKRAICEAANISR